MIISSECYECLLRRHVDTARTLGSDEQATAFARDMMGLFLDAPPEAVAPWFAPGIAELFVKHYAIPYDRYQAEKEQSNRFVLEHMDEIRQTVAEADDPLYTALQIAILGNYLDFSALQGEVDFHELQKMLRFSRDIRVDETNFESLRREFAEGKNLLYLTDNAGEIGFDRVFAEEIHRQYPDLNITFCVRGGPALNDATREDAEIVGIPFPVIDNGTCYPGTVLPCAGEELKQAIETADVIFAKGQANVETLLDSGLNIYYAFLVKCPKFVQLFGQPKLTPMLHRERK